jgi:hypothetical protein
MNTIPEQFDAVPSLPVEGWEQIHTGYIVFLAQGVDLPLWLQYVI